jgi:hypothetical protein
MSEVGVSETASTRAFCGSCGGAITARDAYCAQCGRQVGTDDDPTVVMGEPPPAAATAPPNRNGTVGIANGAPVMGATQPPPPGGYPHPGYAGVPPQGPPAAYPTGAYPVPVPPRRTNIGLIVGLIAAGFAAVGLIVAVVLLATGSHDTTPTVTATNAATPITPVAPSTGSALAQSGSTNPGTFKPSQPKPVPTTSTPAPTTSTPTPAPRANVADVQAARQVVVDQWGLIGSGDFSGAAQKWSPAMGGDWISSHQQEAPITVANLSVGAPTMNSSSDATVPLNSLTTTASDGCMDWSGSYDVINVGGQWLMHQANINGTKC